MRRMRILSKDIVVESEAKMCVTSAIAIPSQVPICVQNHLKPDRPSTNSLSPPFFPLFPNSRTRSIRPRTQSATSVSGMVMTTEEKEKRGEVCIYRVDGHMTVCTDMLTHPIRTEGKRRQDQGKHDVEGKARRGEVSSKYRQSYQRWESK